MKYLTCWEKIRAIYATQAQEDPTMTLERAKRAHEMICRQCNQWQDEGGQA